MINHRESGKPSIAVDALMAALQEAAAVSGFTMTQVGNSGSFPILVFTRHAECAGKFPCYYLSAGIHGDEPAGPLAILRMLEESVLSRDVHWIIFPVVCPQNLALGCRTDVDGRDPNRDYRELKLREIRAHVIWMRKNLPHLDRALLLHEDWESPGFYLYEQLFGGASSLASAILKAVRTEGEVNKQPVIEGLPAHEGCISFYGVQPGLNDWPEALWLGRHGAGRVYTLETPGGMPLEQRVAMHYHAVVSSFT